MEEEEEDRGGTLPSGAPVGFSPRVETARVSDRDRKKDRRKGGREGKKERGKPHRKTDRQTDTGKERDIKTRQERGGLAETGKNTSI